MKKVLFLLLIALFTLSGCGGNGSQVTNLQHGSLVLNISESEVNAKTIQPNLDMTITTYDIIGSGPNGTSFHTGNVTPGAAVTINTLAVGAWTIEVDAKNAGGTMIALGITTDIQVTAGTTANASVAVRPVNGTGTLDVSVSWPNGVIANPSVTGSLTPAGGSAQTITYTLAGNSLSANYHNDSLATGYYTLITQLRDGATVKWGGIDTVRIINGQTSTGAYQLQAMQGQLGDVQLDITPDLQNPITIAFSGQQETLPIGTDMTITATLSQSVDSYQWYLNGTLLPDETGPSITIGKALGEGNYRLDVVVTKGSIVGSASLNFQIQASDSNDIIVFGTNNGSGGDCTKNIFMRIDKDGNLRWTKTFPFAVCSIVSWSWARCFGRDLQEDSFYIVNESSPGGTKNLYKFDFNGNLLWNKSLSSTEQCYLSVNFIDGGVYAGDNNGVYKIDKSGNIIWGPLNWGISDLYKISVDDKSGGLYIGGSSKLAKIDKNGTLIWNINISGAGNIHFNPIDNSIYVNGEDDLGTNQYQSEIYRISSDGNIIWTKSDFPSCYVYGIDVCPIDGSVILGGGWPFDTVRIGMNSNNIFHLSGKGEWRIACAADSTDWYSTFSTAGSWDVRKFNGNGQIIWEKKLTNVNWDAELFVVTGHKR